MIVARSPLPVVHPLSNIESASIASSMAAAACIELDALIEPVEFST